MTRKQKYQQVINHLMEARNLLATIVRDGDNEPEATAFFFEVGCVLHGNSENVSHEVELNGLIRFVEKLEG